ncbi:hypothetical protein MiAbB_04624 [Microcystis aeruginosa NIES-4285]|uniref:Uncharacterized protein n=1 Tax=Microcystis aeruginosa NIES-4285 TaxID=2497681 RepID=A0A402DKI2_MICAE|nr:hypothetical protein MiAbB_04624 [Microcystis aeruginosa NIES-4285]
MVKSLISKGLTVPHRCENRYVRDNQSKIPFNQRQNLLVPVNAAFTPKRLR